MKRKVLATALLLLAVCSVAWADRATEAAQQKLKDDGFYYGEINGQKDADTIAAIRRYQIRNGLKITGELDAETQRSLGLSVKPAATPATRPAQTPGPTPPDYRPPNSAPTVTPAPYSRAPDYEEEEDDDEPAPPPPVPPNLQNTAPLGGTPYEAAPPAVQRDIFSRAQIILMRQGYYRDEIDGAYGPALSVALRNYQTRFGLFPTGRLDVETLALLNLLPEQQANGGRRYHRRPFFAPRPRYWRPNEPIYIPR